jgi:arylformamidase
VSDPFRIRDHVADFDAIVADIIGRSAETRGSLPIVADLAYGSGPSETVDLFFPAECRPGMPVHMFIHGGYWRMFSKRDYSCIAETITAAGAIAVIVDYALMPSVRMAMVVDQVRRARDWVRRRIADHGGDPARISVSGHSAGAHLASFLFTRDRMPSGLRAALLLGGLYELAPLQTSFLQAEIGLTDAEVTTFAPMLEDHDPSVRVEVLVGADETPPFHQQAHDFAGRLRAGGSDVTLGALAGRNHMTSVRDLAIAESEAGRHLAEMIVRT